MPGNFGDKERLQHILDAIAEIESYTNQVSFDNFVANSMMRFASVKQLEIIGEAANYVSDDLKTKFPEIPWSKIVGMRNILVHKYFGVDENIVWGIIKKDLSELKIQIERILSGL